MMSRSNDDTERVVRQALRQDDAAGFPSADDVSMVELVTETFRGRNRRLAAGAVLVTLEMMVAAVFSVSRLLATQDLRQMILWGGAALFCLAAVLAMKVWYWLELLRLAVTRDLKRLELQVSRLAERVGAPPAE
jgi:hypothetical protein